MTEWIDFSVYAAMIVALWFVLPMWGSRFTLRFVADRNPEWLSRHPEVATKLTGGGWLRWVPYAWGVLSLAVLLIFQADLWPQAFGFVPEEAARWETLKDPLDAAPSWNPLFRRRGRSFHPVAAESCATCRSAAGDARAPVDRRFRPAMAPIRHI